MVIPTAIMMDCSDMEALAIELAYNDTKVSILYCTWHCMRSWQKQLRDKVSRHLSSPKSNQRSR
jgi:hypothetical protein